MPDREKVIRGLKACNRQPYNGSDCQNCPYYDDEGTAELPFGICNIQDMFDDALALLKEQEAHIVTEEDYKNADFDGDIPAWAEHKDQSTESEKDGWIILALAWQKRFDCHSIRFWTSRPTDEQRKAMAWND